MRGLIVALAITGGVVILFIGGMFSGSTGLGIAGFCAAPLAFIYLGWALRGSGLRVTVGAPQPAARTVTSGSAGVSRLARLQQQQREKEGAL